MKLLFSLRTLLTEKKIKTTGVCLLLISFVSLIHYTQLITGQTDDIDKQFITKEEKTQTQDFAAGRPGTQGVVLWLKVTYQFFTGFFCF